MTNDLPNNIDPVKAMEAIFRVRLPDGTLVDFVALPFQRKFFQAGPLYGNKRTRITKKSRKLGFTMMLMMEYLFLGEKHPFTFYPFAATTADQGAHAVDILRQLVSDAKFRFSIRPENITAYGARWDTGSELQVFSGSNPNSARGPQAYSAAMDEYAFNPVQKEMMAAFSPMLVGGGQLTLLSTLNGVNNEFYRILTEAERDPKHYVIIEQTVFENPERFDLSRSIPEQITEGLRIVAPWITAEALERDRIRDPVMFMQEYMCVPSESSYALFPGEEVEAAVVPGVWEYGSLKRVGMTEVYFTGCDFALSTGASADYSAMPIGRVDRDDIIEIVHFYREKGRATPDQLSDLYEYYQSFRPVTMLLEKNNMGDPIFQMLRLKVPTVQDFSTTEQSKRSLIRQLQSYLHNKKIRIREGTTEEEREKVTQWKREMKAFSRIENKQGTNYKLKGSGQHDDMVMATALLVQAVIDWQGTSGSTSPIARSPEFWGPVNVSAIEQKWKSDRAPRKTSGGSVRVIR